MITAERIKRSYDRYAQNYDSGTQLQRSLADKLINAVQLDGIKFSKVLDIGCGTGYLLSSLRAERSEAKQSPIFGKEIASVASLPRNDGIVGCDISFGMLNCARDKGSRYVQSDASVLPFSNSIFDLVVSNAAYQWVRDLKTAFSEVKRVLKPAGKFYFVVFNNNTLWQLQDVCKGINVAGKNFPDKDKLHSSLAEAGFKIDSIEIFSYVKYYKDLWELLGTLKNIGSTSADNKVKGLAWRAILQQVNDLYIAKFANENGIPATYEVFLINVYQAAA